MRPELARVNAELAGDLMPEQPELRPLVEHAVSYRGKQLRPALVFLAGKAIGELSEDHVITAKVVELLHTASLVHDDVLDSAEIRRKVQTINALHGNEMPVLLGDYIYSRAFTMSVGVSDKRCPEVLGDIARRMCQGEITQILHRFDYSWDEARYYRVIEDKTALLYGAAAGLGAHYAGGNQKQVESLDRFGTELGIAFQIIDDILDVKGDEAVVGKSLGTDLHKGKLTLPMLWLMREPKDGVRLRALMERDGTELEKLEVLAREFDLDGACEYAMAEARRRVGIAIESLDVLPDCPARDAMAGMAEFVLARRL